MEISFTELKQREVVNVYDGKKLGRIIDIVFDNETRTVKGVVLPGEHKLFRKTDDLFVPLELLKKVGDDVIFVKLNTGCFEASAKVENDKKHSGIVAENEGYGRFSMGQRRKMSEIGQSQSNYLNIARYRRVSKQKFN